MTAPGRLVLAVARHELRVMQRETTAFVVLFAVPLLVMAFTAKPVGIAACTVASASCDQGARATAGVAALFLFLFVSAVGFAYHHEYGWGTWPRLRAAGVSVEGIALGKGLPLVGLAAAQQVGLVVIGLVAFAVPVGWRTLLAVPVALVAGLLAVTVGTLIVTATSTIREVNAVAMLGTMLLGGLGGTLTPTALLPGWVQPLSRVSPTFWVLQGYRQALDPGGPAATAALAPLALLGGLTVLAGAVAARRLRRLEPRPGAGLG